jgi:hypothetical protein
MVALKVVQSTTTPTSLKAIKEASIRGSSMVKWTSGVLTVGLIGYEFSRNIRAYWKGDIDAIKCTANCTSAVTGAAGATAGAVYGSVFGPVGSVIGGVLGGISASAATDQCFILAFGNDRERVLKQAYRILGIAGTDPDTSVRRAYLTLAMKHHPDKNKGSKAAADKFVKVNQAYELIRAARGES